MPAVETSHSWNRPPRVAPVGMIPASSSLPRSRSSDQTSSITTRSDCAPCNASAFGANSAIRPPFGRAIASDPLAIRNAACLPIAERPISGMRSSTNRSRALCRFWAVYQARPWSRRSAAHSASGAVSVVLPDWRGTVTNTVWYR